jgi:large subunit ribosomal protein L23
MSRVNPTPASRSKYDEGRLMQVLVAPIVSEKATHVADKTNAVTFKVLQDATKPEIKAAVELMFKVEVKGVSVANIKGKAKRFGKSSGRRDNIRKAYVTLKPGQELNLAGEAA